MNKRRPLRSDSILALCIIASCIIAAFTSCRSPDTGAHTNSSLNPALQPIAPIGFYTLATDLGYHYITISLDGTGDYQVTSALIGFNKFSRTQRGRWTWNQQREEFLLTPDPASEDLGYEFRRLRLDDRDPDTLQWLPFNDLKGSPGASDYIRFRREN